MPDIGTLALIGGGLWFLLRKGVGAATPTTTPPPAGTSFGTSSGDWGAFFDASADHYWYNPNTNQVGGISVKGSPGWVPVTELAPVMYQAARLSYLQSKVGAGAPPDLSYWPASPPSTLTGLTPPPPPQGTGYIDVSLDGRTWHLDSGINTAIGSSPVKFPAHSLLIVALDPHRGWVILTPDARQGIAMWHATYWTQYV